jgi:hypothetical protein
MSLLTMCKTYRTNKDSLTQFLSYVDKVDKWKLMHRTALLHSPFHSNENPG